MKNNWLTTAILALVAAIVYSVSAVGWSFPTLLAPICGVVAVVTFFHLVRAFVAANVPADASASPHRPATLAALVAAVVLMLTPAVRSAATHFEPGLLDFTWALLIAALAIPFLARRGSKAAALFPVLAGVAWALGFAHSALFLALLPLYLILAGRVSRPVRSPVLFLLAGALTVLVVFGIFHVNPALFFRRTLIEFSSYYRTPGWFYVFFFTTLPFLTVLFSEDGALRERPGFVQLFFHGALSFVTVLAVVPPLSPSALLAPYGRLPAVTSAFAAAVAGYLVAYWWVNRGTRTARAVGGALGLVLAGVALWNLFAFDGKAAALAARAARRVVVRMDGRRAQEILKKDPDAPFANYVMGSLALKAGRIAEAEPYLRKAASAPQPLPFALNDLAESLRLGGNYAEAERYARQCVKRAPNLYIGWETLGSVLMDADKDLAEAESAIRRACELSKGKDNRPADVRMLVSLARVQRKRGNAQLAQETIRQIQSRLNELSESERAACERLLQK